MMQNRRVQSDMAYTIRLEKEHEYVRLTFLGMVTRGVLDRALEDIYHELIRNGWYKIFIDTTRGDIVLSPTELYVFARMFRSKFLVDAATAVLARPDQIGVVRFIENMTYNRMDLRGYTDEETAHKWLVRRSRHARESARAE
jgi:hypothetical protein